MIYHSQQNRQQRWKILLTCENEGRAPTEKEAWALRDEVRRLKRLLKRHESVLKMLEVKKHLVTIQ